MAHQIHRRQVVLSPARVALIVVVVLALVGGGVAAGVLLSGGSHRAGSGGGRGAGNHPATSAAGAPSTTAPAPPLRLTSVAPRSASVVPGTAHLEVSFSADLDRSSPAPVLSPPEPGRWSVRGSHFVFVPAGAYLPLTAVRLELPGGAHGIRAADGVHLGRSTTVRFTVSDGSTTRLQQLLSDLDYSPLRFLPAGRSPSSSDTAAQLAALYQPPAGSFAWRAGGWPSQLASLWRPGYFGVMTRGLVMEFQADHGIDPNGLMSTALWRALVDAIHSNDVNTGGYNYALASQTAPESLTIWHDGGVVLHAPANTGIAQAPTANGNFNVFARFRSQVMRGTNPDGSKYADPVQYVAYFNGGDAVHYIPRANYGIPQSLGCVELDLSDAAKAWPYLAYGTIVSILP